MCICLIMIDPTLIPAKVAEESLAKAAEEIMIIVKESLRDSESRI